MKIPTCVTAFIRLFCRQLRQDLRDISKSILFFHKEVSDKPVTRMIVEDQINPDFYAENPEVVEQNLKIAIEILIPFFEYLKDLEKKGVDVNLIVDAVESIHDRWTSLSGALSDGLDYSDHRGVLKRERAINNAFSLLCNLPPIFSDLHKRILQGQGIDPAIDNQIIAFNEALEAMQKHMKSYEALLQKYLDVLVLEETYHWDGATDKVEVRSKDLFARLFLGKCIDVNQIRSWMKINTKITDCEATIDRLSKKEKKTPEENKALSNANEKLTSLKNKVKLTQSSRNVSGPSIVTIVNELKRAGFSANEAYRKTAELLKLYFPDIYTDTNQNLVRQHYQYHKKK